MRNNWLILTILLLLFGAKPVYAVTITISNIPSSVTDQSFNVDVSVSGASSGTNYLRIDLYKEGTTNYFGETYNGSSWYNGSSGTQYTPISITSGQTANTTLTGRIGSPTSTEYPGSGSYKIKIRRYTSSGNAASSDTQTPQDISISYSSPTPAPTSTTTSTPTPTPSTTTTSTSTSSSTSFTISNTPTSVDSTQEFKVSINLTASKNPNTIFYLKGAFKKQDESNYFGMTKVSANWVRNYRGYEDQYKITTDSSGSWSGNLEVRPDILDSGYDGAGEYIFKVARYSEGGSLSWSNEAKIKINAQEITSEDEESEVLGISETNQKNTYTKLSVEENYSLEKYIKVSTPSTSKASSSAKPTTSVKSEKKINFIIIIGVFLVIIGLSFPIYAKYNQFRKRNQRFS